MADPAAALATHVARLIRAFAEGSAAASELLGSLAGDPSAAARAWALTRGLLGLHPDGEAQLRTLEPAAPGSGASGSTATAPAPSSHAADSREAPASTPALASPRSDALAGAAACPPQVPLSGAAVGEAPHPPPSPAPAAGVVAVSAAPKPPLAVHGAESAAAAASGGAHPGPIAAVPATAAASTPPSPSRGAVGVAAVSVPHQLVPIAAGSAAAQASPALAPTAADPAAAAGPEPARAAVAARVASFSEPAASRQHVGPAPSSFSLPITISAAAPAPATGATLSVPLSLPSPSPGGAGLPATPSPSLLPTAAPRLAEPAAAAPAAFSLPSPASNPARHAPPPSASLPPAPAAQSVPHEDATPGQAEPVNLQAAVSLTQLYFPPPPPRGPRVWGDSPASPLREGGQQEPSPRLKRNGRLSSRERPPQQGSGKGDALAPALGDDRGGRQRGVELRHHQADGPGSKRGGGPSGPRDGGGGKRRGDRAGAGNGGSAYPLGDSARLPQAGFNGQHQGGPGGSRRHGGAFGRSAPDDPGQRQRGPGASGGYPDNGAFPERSWPEPERNGWGQPRYGNGLAGAAFGGGHGPPANQGPGRADQRHRGRQPCRHEEQHQWRHQEPRRRSRSRSRSRSRASSRSRSRSRSASPPRAAGKGSQTRHRSRSSGRRHEGRRARSPGQAGPAPALPLDGLSAVQTANAQQVEELQRRCAELSQRCSFLEQQRATAAAPPAPRQRDRIPDPVDVLKPLQSSPSAQRPVPAQDASAPAVPVHSIVSPGSSGSSGSDADGKRKAHGASAGGVAGGGDGHEPSGAEPSAGDGDLGGDDYYGDCMDDDDLDYEERGSGMHAGRVSARSASGRVWGEGARALLPPDGDCERMGCVWVRTYGGCVVAMCNSPSASGHGEAAS